MALLTAAFFVLAVLLLAAAVWLLRAGRQAALRAQVDRHFREISDFSLRGGGRAAQLRGSTVDRWLRRAGIRLTPARVAVGVAFALAAAGVAWGVGGPVAMATVLAAVAAFAGAWPQLQYRRRAAAMAGQIPLFLDQVVRGLATGRNLDGALRMAVEESRPPLGEVMIRVQQVVDLGEDIGEAVRDAARLYDVRELHFMAMAVQIARGYGSSPKEMLESVAKLVRHREQAQRELKALTGETRISAWLLSVLPSALALYMVAVNPDYINAMWHDPTGRVVLLLALALQATGGIILWRMVKSV